tara:strand:+ start:1930 stop:3618 length:1689 start_codon:yes stop_codon:yes gene_type:complete
MKFKEMTKEEKETFTKIYKDKNLSWDERMQLLMELTGKSERTVRKWASEKLKISEKSEVKSPLLIKAEKREFDKSKKRFIVTWAQNDTPIHKKFFLNMQAFAHEHKADIHVIAGRYKNPTSVFTDKDHENWHPDVLPYLDAARHDLHKYVSIMSDVKIQPTAVNPMTGLQGMSGINTCVFGHPKMQMEMIPVLEDSKPKMMLTTGACTVSNYTDSKAGKKGEFHHQLGFVIIEIKDDETFYVRQVTADDDGNFSDLFYDVTFEGVNMAIKFDNPMEKSNWITEHCGDKPLKPVGTVKITKKKKVEACILGDLHYGHHDQEVLDETHEFMGKLKPKNVILHDVFDGYSISHHTMKNPFIQYGKEMNGTNDLKKEVDELMFGLKKFKKYKNVIIVRSNHDDFLDRWLIDGDWKKQPTHKNSPLYMEYSSILLRQHAETPENVLGVIPELITRKFPKFKTLGRKDSYRILDWEVGQHGDKGSNGSRGSLVQFRKLNTKIIVGHYHSPGRKDGALAVGTTTKMRVGYNQGPSSWLQSHVIIHQNGKVQHVNFIRDNEGKVGYTTLN